MGKGIIVVKEGHKGTLRNENGKELTYTQQFSTELGIEVGRNVIFDTVIDSSTNERIAYNVELARKGKIITVKDGHKGTIQDDNFGEIEADIPYNKERGLFVGQEVRYRLLFNGRTYVAVYVDPVPER